MQFAPEVLQAAESGKERLDIHIHYSPHISLQDLATAEQLIRSGQYDIYAPEMTHHTPQLHYLHRRISTGDSTLYAQIEKFVSDRPDSLMSLAGLAIYESSGMPLIFPDITSQEGAQYDVEDVSEMRLHFAFDSFENDFERTKQVVHTHAKNIYFRDHLIATKLPAQAVELAPEISQLRKKDRVKVLATLGVRHTLVSHLLNERGYKGSRSFSTKPFVFTPLDIAARQVAFGREGTDKMYMDAFKQYILWLPLGEHAHFHPDDTASTMALTERAVNMMSDDKARELYDLLMASDPRFKEVADEFMEAVKAA